MEKNPAGSPLTRLLADAGRGDDRAAAELLPLVYGELRRLAVAWMARLPPGQTLQPTALVHEAYARLAGRDHSGWENRRHFFFAAARAMRDLLVEDARRKATRKRGEGRPRVETDSLGLAIDAPPYDLLALEEALERLEAYDSRKHELVMLRFYAGLTAEEAAEVLGVSVRTVHRDWSYVQARLHRELTGEEPEG